MRFHVGEKTKSNSEIGTTCNARPVIFYTDGTPYIPEVPREYWCSVIRTTCKAIEFNDDDGRTQWQAVITKPAHEKRLKQAAKKECTAHRTAMRRLSIHWRPIATAL